jgi:DNA end-binding protein Ku
MPRSIWNGTVAFGLVTVPVKLYSATQSKTVHFHEIHLKDGSRIEHRRFCTQEDRQVPYEEVVSGFEVAPDEYVVLSKEERSAAAGDPAHRIDVEQFVPAEEIDAVFFERTYHVGPGKDGDDTYRLLHDALVQTGRAAIGRFRFHDREYLTALRPRDGLLVLHTLRFADELVNGHDVDAPDPQRAPDDREVKMARALVDNLHEDFDASRYRDEYRQAVLDVIERKARGEEVKAPEEAPPEPSDDLLAALEASLAGAQKGGNS